MTDLADLDDDELVELWKFGMRQHTKAEWLAEWRARRIGRRPSEPTVAYRGAHSPEGMSWTSEQAAAQRYADRNGSPLYWTTLKRSAILAVIEPSYGWSDDVEYVVDPERLRRVYDLAERQPPGVSAPAPPQTTRERTEGTYGERMLARNTERRRIERQRGEAATRRRMKANTARNRAEPRRRRG